MCFYCAAPRQICAGAPSPSQPVRASPRARGWDQNKLRTHFAVDSTYPDFLISGGSIEFLFEAPLTCTPYTLYTEVSILLRTLPRPNLPLRSSAATFYVVSPIEDLAPTSEIAFSVVRVRPDGRPVRRHGPSRRPDSPVTVLESW